MIFFFGHKNLKSNLPKKGHTNGTIRFRFFGREVVDSWEKNSHHREKTHGGSFFNPSFLKVWKHTADQYFLPYPNLSSFYSCRTSFFKVAHPAFKRNITQLLKCFFLNFRNPGAALPGVRFGGLGGPFFVAAEPMWMGLNLGDGIDEDRHSRKKNFRNALFSSI